MRVSAEAGWTFATMADAWAAGLGGPAAIARRQRRRLADLVAHARRHSPYYAQAYRDLPAGLDDIGRLPPTTRASLMARFDEWATDRAVTWEAASAFVADPGAIGDEFLGRYALWTTSGTTGAPAVLVHDARSLAVLAGLAALRTLPDWHLAARLARRGTKAAGVYAAGGHPLACAATARRHRLRPATRHRLKAIPARAPVEVIARALEAFQPALLGSCPAVLRLLANERRAGRLDIRPALVASGGEALAPADRGLIAAAFEAPVINPYACAEAGLLAGECGHGWQHVNADWVVLEPVDADYRPTPPGERSHTALLTYLGNHVQPILRYDLGDRLLTRPDPCPCGSPLPAIRVEGRTDDGLHLRTAAGHVVPGRPADHPAPGW